MLLIPAIDLKDGQCVRLQQGDMNKATTFNTDPVEQALHWLDWLESEHSDRHRESSILHTIAPQVQIEFE